jgi:hypothetical protein
MEAAASELMEVVSEAPGSPGRGAGQFFDVDSPTAAAAAEESRSESLGLYIITPPTALQGAHEQRQQEQEQ